MNDHGVGIVGYGRFGRMHARALQQIPGAKLVAINAGSEESGKQTTDELHVPVFLDYDEFLRQEDLQSVTLVTPNSTHAELAIKALNAGKNVYLEKPMATNLDDAAKLIETKERMGRVVQIGFENRYSKFWRTAKSIIDSGKIGEAVSGKIDVWRFPMRSGSKGWKYDKDAVGHQLLEEAIHHTDISNWLMGRNAISVLSYTDDLESFRTGRLTNVWLLIKYEEDRRFLITDSLNGFGVDITLTVSAKNGTVNGAIRADSDDAREVHSYVKLRDKENKTDTISIELEGQLADLTAALNDFILAAKYQKESKVTVYDGFNSLAICMAALKSVESGKFEPIKWAKPHS